MVVPPSPDGFIQFHFFFFGGKDMNDDTRTAAWWSRAILIGAIVGAALVPVGAVGTRLALWPFTIGLLLLAAGTLLAVVALVLGIIALIVVVSRGRTAERPHLYWGLLIAGALAFVMLPQLKAGMAVPPIHDITTDVADPPTFDVIVHLREDLHDPRVNTLDYDKEKLPKQQQAAYPNVKTITSAADVGADFDLALQVLTEMGLEVVNADRDAGRIEATATSRWFGFKDDVVVRIRAAATGSVIDVRSVSRVGIGDVGVNAKRIETFIARFNQA
jgi:uncharacterized protein (DUF1499 family)